MALNREDFSFVLRLLTPTNRLVIRLAAETGLRISDCLSMTSNQLQTAIKNNGYVYLLESKTGKKRRVYLSKSLRGDLVLNVSVLSPFLFPNRFDNLKHRTRQAIWKDIHRAAIALRFDGQISPHSIRKMAAQEKLCAVNGNTETVRRWLNHSDSSVTAIYILAKHAHSGAKHLPKKRG